MPGHPTLGGFRKGCKKTQHVGTKLGAQTPTKIANATLGLLHSGLSDSRRHVLAEGRLMSAPWRPQSRRRLFQDFASAWR